MDVGAIVFDFDGLILDTESSIYASWQRVFAERASAPLTIDDWGAEVGGVGGIDVIALLEERALDDLDMDAIQAARRAHRDELLAVETVLPGVVNWLDEAKALGLGIAIASSSEVEWVESHLVRLGLRDRFAHLACRDIEVAAKPAPDTYLAACAALGVAPSAAVAVEDSPPGIRAAHAAGLRAIAVPNAVTGQLDLSEADLRLESLASCTLGEALARLAA
jgi:HAD superfamily hydrolase (TIGR01509 family)